MGSPPQLQLSTSPTGHDPREHTEALGAGAELELRVRMTPQAPLNRESTAQH